MAGVVDADTHIIEHPGMWELFDPELYPRRPVLASTTDNSVYGHNNQVWLIDGVAVPKRFGKGSAIVAVGGSDAEEARTDIAKAVRYITDATARVSDMDKRGVDAEVVFPTLLLGYLPVEVDLEIAICAAYNRYLAKAWEQGGDRLRWVVVPPLRDIRASVREIETARDHGAVGVFFRGVEGERSLAESYFFPVYEAANRLGMAICIHTGAGAPEITKVFDRSFSHNLPHVRSLPLFAFRDLVAHKIPERFPQLRIGFIEASASWVPYVLHHLATVQRRKTQLWRRRRCSHGVGTKAIQRLPALRCRRGGRRPGLSPDSHWRRQHDHGLGLRPPGSIQRRWYGGCDAAQEKHIAGGDRKNSLRQPASLLWTLTIMRRQLTPTRSGNIKIKVLTPIKGKLSSHELRERV